MKQNLQFEEVQQFAAENNLTLNPQYIKNNRMKLTDEVNAMNPKIIDDPRNEPGVGTYWEENFKAGKIGVDLNGLKMVLPGHWRFDIASQLNRSPDPLTRRFRETFISDPVVGNPKGDTAVEWKQRSQYKTLYPFMNKREVALQSFKKLNKDVSFGNTIKTEDKFESLMSDLKEFPERFVDSKEITNEMRELLPLADKAFNDTLDIISQTSREGWKEVARFRKKNYIPHVHSQPKLNNYLTEYGREQVEEVYKNSLRSMKGDLGEKTFNLLIKRMIDKISSPNFFR